MIQWILATKFGRMFGGAIVAVLMLFGVYVHGRKTGADDATENMVKQDRKGADNVRKKAASVKRGGDAVSRLRANGGLRD